MTTENNNEPSVWTKLKEFLNGEKTILGRVSSALGEKPESGKLTFSDRHSLTLASYADALVARENTSDKKEQEKIVKDAQVPQYYLDDPKQSLVSFLVSLGNIVGLREGNAIRVPGNNIYDNNYGPGSERDLASNREKVAATKAMRERQNQAA